MTILVSTTITLFVNIIHRIHTHTNTRTYDISHIWAGNNQFIIHIYNHYGSCFYLYMSSQSLLNAEHKIKARKTSFAYVCSRCDCSIIILLCIFGSECKKGNFFGEFVRVCDTSIDTRRKKNTPPKNCLTNKLEPLDLIVVRVQRIYSNKLQILLL